MSTKSRTEGRRKNDSIVNYNMLNHLILINSCICIPFSTMNMQHAVVHRRGTRLHTCEGQVTACQRRPCDTAEDRQRISTLTLRWPAGFMWNVQGARSQLMFVRSFQLRCLRGPRGSEGRKPLPAGARQGLSGLLFPGKLEIQVFRWNLAFYLSFSSEFKTFKTTEGSEKTSFYWIWPIASLVLLLYHHSQFFIGNAHFCQIVPRTNITG